MIPAVVLGIYVILMNADAVDQIFAAQSLDYDRPVVAIQKRLAAVRVRHDRTVRWILLSAALVWTPLLVAALASFAIDSYTVLRWGYLAANAALGVVVIAAAYAASRRYSPPIAHSRFGLRLANMHAGSALTSALESLETVLRFEQEQITA